MIVYARTWLRPVVSVTSSNKLQNYALQILHCPPNSGSVSNFTLKTVKQRFPSNFRKTIPVKMMIQQRQFRHTHIDPHYCAALFRYMKEYAISMKDHCLMVCLDDKHRVKVGEPGLPVASVERGKKVLVALNHSSEVCDHDFTRFSLIPNVTLLNRFPWKYSRDGIKR